MKPASETAPYLVRIRKNDGNVGEIYCDDDNAAKDIINQALLTGIRPHQLEVFQRMTIQILGVNSWLGPVNQNGNGSSTTRASLRAPKNKAKRNTRTAARNPNRNLRRTVRNTLTALGGEASVAEITNRIERKFRYANRRSCYSAISVCVHNHSADFKKISRGIVKLRG